MFNKRPSATPAEGAGQTNLRALAPPEVPPPYALPLLSDESAYTIPLSAQAADLPVDVTVLWGGVGGLFPGETTYVYFYWDNELAPSDTQRITAPYGASDLPVTGYIPLIKLSVPGPHLLRYEVELTLGSTVEPSAPIMINLDKEAPNQGQRGTPLIFPTEIVRDGVTDAYLASHGDRVVATVQPWPDIRLEDRVDGYLLLLPFRDRRLLRNRLVNKVATVTIDASHKAGAPIELVFEGAALRAHRNGNYDAHYYLTDRGGNEGPRSITANLLIDLTPTPSILPPVDMPQLANGRIDLEDARAPGGVYMNILEFFGWADGDVLQPFWNLIPLASITLTTGQTWPIRVNIDYVTLARGGAEFIPAVIRAYYTWQRGSSPAIDSDPRFVPVDLTVAGPVSPANPNPINRLLDQVTVKGVNGDNLLTIDDQNQPARVVLPLYNNPVVNQVLELRWGDPGVLADTYTVQPGDRAGDEIEFFVPWALIESTPGSPVPTFYWTFNGVNRQRSIETRVTVNIVKIIGLLPPEFPDVHYGPGPGSGFINCALRPWDGGVRVRIPGDRSRLAGGDEVQLFWAGYRNTNGADSGLIVGTELTLSHTLTLSEAENGYVFRVPFTPYIMLPGLVTPPAGQTDPRNGSGVVKYVVTKPAGGGMGDSERVLVAISLIRPNLPPCIGDD